MSFFVHGLDKPHRDWDTNLCTQNIHMLLAHSCIGSTTTKKLEKSIN